jgi:hypothetical protein
MAHYVQCGLDAAGLGVAGDQNAANALPPRGVYGSKAWLAGRMHR